MRGYRGIGCALTFTCASSAFALDVVINPGPNLSANPAALAAFNRAATTWEHLLSDPITVTVNGDIVPMPFGAAATSAVAVGFNFDFVRNKMVTDALDEGTDDAIVASIPTSADFTATVPPGSSLNGSMLATKANLKAIGVNVDDVFGPNDATITFNTNRPWDYDNSNGVGAAQVDFESAALHEIGHALGFSSIVESTSGTTITPLPLDLFRFQNGSADVDPTEATFATTPRYLVQGGVPIFDDGVNEWAMSSQLDGFGAGHWKDDSLTGTYLGVMNPRLPAGRIAFITNADLRALDLIGYEITTVPEPASLSALTLAAVGLRRRRSNRPSEAGDGESRRATCAYARWTGRYTFGSSQLVPRRG
jgi:hypothetical protein